MSSADGSIRFLVKNIEQLQGLGRLEAILPILEAMKVLLTETQFDVSMIDLTMSADNRAIARRFLVDGVTTAELKKAGVSPSRLSKVVGRVITNFHKQIESLDLVSGHYILDAKTSELIQQLEIAKVGEAQLRQQVKTPAGRRRAASRRNSRQNQKPALDAVNAENAGNAGNADSAASIESAENIENPKSRESNASQTALVDTAESETGSQRSQHSQHQSPAASSSSSVRD